MRSMKVIGLISGGKDSVYNLMQCIKNGHQIACLGHLARPSDKEGILNKNKKIILELDSYMYQTVGSEAADGVAKCLDLPLFKRYLL